MAVRVVVGGGENACSSETRTLPQGKTFARQKYLLPLQTPLQVSNRFFDQTCFRHGAQDGNVLKTYMCNVQVRKTLSWKWRPGLFFRRVQGNLPSRALDRADTADY